MELYFPTELGEQVAFICSAVTALLGLLAFLLPAFALRLSALLSAVLDRGVTFKNITFFLLQVVLAGGPLAYVFGYI
jgi:hypothetical protein